VLEIFGGDDFSMGLQIVVALALLMLGRRLYWLFVAGVGFVVTMTLAQQYLQVEQAWMATALAIGAGILGGLFAIVLQRLAVAIAGFLATAYFTMIVAPQLGLDGQILQVAIVVAGILGAIFASVLFDWALIFLSSITGAVMLVDLFNIDRPLSLVVMVVLATAGVSIQANMLHRDKGKG
jgi:hypothetical protein